MMPQFTASKKWDDAIEFYEELSAWHRQEPMKTLVKTLVKAVAEAGTENAVWPTHSHFVLRVFADTSTNSDVSEMSSVSAEYRHEVYKFRLSYFHIRGISYDEKWCDLAEAAATLRHVFRSLWREA